MKKVYTTIIAFIMLFITACSDGKGKFDTGTSKIDIADCNTSSYTTMQDNDLLVEDSDSTLLQIIHDSNGTKKVCIQTGSAHIIRSN